MSSPFFSGLLTLVAADEEVALIPPAQTFLTALTNAKTGLQRSMALVQLEGNVLAAESNVGPQLLAQVLPQLNAALAAQLAKEQAVVANPPKLT
jgi:hypothetical protein